MKTCSLERRSGGFAFIAALMVILVVAILVTAILTMTMSSRMLAGSRQEYAQALYLAEAGINALISEWRVSGLDNPPANPYTGVIENNGAPGSFVVEWGPDPDAPFGRTDWIRVVSTGTVNTGLPGTVYHVSRTVQTTLDVDGDWAWNRVYYSDSTKPGMGEPDYAVINGTAGQVEIEGMGGQPSDFADHPNGPGGGSLLPSPMWDKWHEWIRLDKACDPVTEELVDRPAGPRWVDQSTLPALTGTTVYAVDHPDRHMFWYGSSSATPVDPIAHAGDGHATNDENDFMPDWYGFNNPHAYICASKNKTFTVIFGKNMATKETYYGNYFIHGDVQIKNGVRIHGTIVATGSISFYGVQNCSIEPEVMNPDDPCEERVYYPAMIAGRDVLVRNQGVGEDDLRDRLRVSGIIWAGRSYTGQASDVEGSVVSPHITLSGNYLTRYGIYNIDGCEYRPGDNPPPWFHEPDRDELQPLPRTWRER